MASRKAPSRKGSRSAFVLRVPSGKIITLTRFRSRSAHSRSARAPLARSPRQTPISPAMVIIQPTRGIRNSSRLESHFISQGRWEIRMMSTNDSWLLTTT
jgi:hypothetical protein